MHALYWLALFFLFIFSGFRYEVGCDWKTYSLIFQYDLTANNALSQLSGEFLYLGLMQLLHEFDLSFRSLNIATSFLFFFGLSSLARREINPLSFLVLAFPILILNLPMSGIRQAVAVGFMCLAITSFVDKKLIKFLTLVFLGAMFHSSAIIFILLAPFVHGNFSVKNILVALILSLPVIWVIYTSGLIDIITMRYLDSNLDSFGAMYRLSILSITGLFFLIYLSPMWKRLYPHDYKIVHIGSWMMLFCIALIPLSSVIADRIGFYLIPFQLMIFSRMPYFDTKYDKLLSVLPYLGLSLVFLVWTQTSYIFNRCYVPYIFNI